MTAAVVMVVGLPFIGTYIPLPTFASVLAILILAILAGFMSPAHIWLQGLNTGVSVVAFIVFETYSIKFYYNHQALFFVVNQVLSLMFLTTLYYSTKTWRANLKK